MLRYKHGTGHKEYSLRVCGYGSDKFIAAGMLDEALRDAIEELAAFLPKEPINAG